MENFNKKIEFEIDENDDLSAKRRRDREKIGYCDANYTFQHELQAFFEDDPRIHVYDIAEISDDHYILRVVINDVEMCEVFRRLIKVPENCRNLRLAVNCSEEIQITEETLGKFLEKNKYFSRVIMEDHEPGRDPILMDYVLMKPEVVQFNNDVFNNPFRIQTMTAEDLANKLLFESSHCNITTDFD